MEPGKLHRPGTVDLPFDQEQRVEVLLREVAARDAEIKALREALDLVYTQWRQRDAEVQAHLRDLQAQIDALDPAPDAPPRPSRAMSQGAPSTSNPVAYGKLITRIRNIVRRALPADATVLVVSRGDEALLALEGREGQHFPQREDGIYAGHHPADSTEAIAHLERLRAKGADYLLIPGTALWWLDHYKAFTRHLQTRYKVTVRRKDTCWIVDLNPGKSSHEQPALTSTPEEQAYQETSAQIEALVSTLLPTDAALLVVSKGDDTLVARCGKKAQHFPQDLDGRYPGYYPGDSEEAIAHLEELRQQGAAYLLFPRTAFWWLEYYEAFKDHLDRHYPVLCRQQHVCLLYALHPRPPVNRQTQTESF